MWATPPSSLPQTLLLAVLLAATGCAEEPSHPAGADAMTSDDTEAADDARRADASALTDSEERDTSSGGSDSAAAEDTAQSGADTELTDTLPDGEICAPACAADARRCDAGQVVACEVDATGCTTWGAPTPCGGGERCLHGECVAPCVASDTRCLDAERVQRCEDGDLEVSGCAYGCDPTVSACRPCPNGGWRCRDDGAGSYLLEVCQGGSSWSLVAQCGACGCAAGAEITMRCLGRDDTPTACAECAADALSCTP